MHAILRFTANLRPFGTGEAALAILCAAAMATAVGGVSQSWQTLAMLQAELASQSAAAAPAVPACSEDVRCMTAKAVQLHAEGVAALERPDGTGRAASRMHAGR